MEAEGARRLYGRSLLRHKLHYIPFEGDGDSKSYTEMKKMAPYGEAVFIPKEDCIRHVTKRMRTALRKLQATYRKHRRISRTILLKIFVPNRGCSLSARTSGHYAINLHKLTLFSKNFKICIDLCSKIKRTS